MTVLLGRTSPVPQGVRPAVGHVLRRSEDGRFLHTFRQSSIKTFDLCAERFRRDDLADVSSTSDAAAVGTAVHACIEYHLNESTDLATLLELWDYEFAALQTDPQFRWVKYTEQSARTFGHQCLSNWWAEYGSWFTARHTEVSFNVPLYETEERIVRLSGTIDVVNDHCWDWKTSGGGPFKKWEYERWAIQPTVYTYAADVLNLCENTTSFTYGVMHRAGVQQFTVTRDAYDWEWLCRKCDAIARLKETAAAPWPMNDTHALCSQKWCDHWASCKGELAVTNR